MPFSIENMLQLREFKDCTVIAGHKGINRVIQCVDTMEVPDITPWLQCGELLITTGYSLEGHLERLIPLLDAMYNNDSAGLMIKTRIIGPIPQMIIDFADSKGIPLIVIPDDMPFIPMVNTIINCISDELNHSFTRFFSMSKDIKMIQGTPSFLNDLADIIYTYFQFPTIITDYLLDVCASCPGYIQLPAFITNDKLLHRMRSTERSSLFISDTSEDAHFLIQQIRIDKLIAGYIILIIPADQHYIKNDGDAMILNYAANIISANFKQENFLNAQVQRKNLSLYSNLVGNLNGVDVQESMKEAPWPLPPFLLITVETEFDEQFNMSDTLLMQLMYSIRTLFKKYGISNMTVPWNNTIRCIVPFNSQAVNRSILSTIKDRVSSLFDRRIRMTVSGRLDGYDQIKSAHFEAYDLLSISRNMNLSIAFADDLLYEIAMLQTLRNSHMRTFAFKLLSTLEDYDAQHGSELIHTLQVLIENRGIQTKTANDLFLHRNTLLYRMRKIESLTGLDLSDSGDLHKAYMALYVHNFAQ